MQKSTNAQSPQLQEVKGTSIGKLRYCSSKTSGALRRCVEAVELNTAETKTKEEKIIAAEAETTAAVAATARSAAVPYVAAAVRKGSSWGEQSGGCQEKRLAKGVREHLLETLAES